MKPLEQKYLALLREAELRKLPDVPGIRLCFQILSLASAIDQDCADQLKPHGLSEGRFIMLFLLESAREGVSPHVLAERAGVRRATVTGLLDGLERDGFVERQLLPHDRRGRLIQLTHKGKSTAKRLFSQHGRWIGGLLADLSEAERQLLSTLLAKVRARLSQQTQATADEEAGA
jgi:DNA-binding MarR family transcriptional regulator